MMPQSAVPTRRHLKGFPPSAILNNPAEKALLVLYEMQTFTPGAPFLPEAQSQELPFAVEIEAIKAQHQPAPHTLHSGRVQPWGHEHEDPATGTQ